MKLTACGRDGLGGHHEVALVLAVLVVHQDDHPAGAEFVEGLVDGAEAFGRAGHERLLGERFRLFVRACGAQKRLVRSSRSAGHSGRHSRSAGAARSTGSARRR